MPLLKNISTLYTCGGEGEQGDIHPIENAAIAWTNDTIEWVGKESSIPEGIQNLESFDAGGKIVIPGLIDCHTHLAFGGWREDDFEMRVRGTSYLDIAKAGGGILSTVKATRDTTEDELYEKASGFADRMLQLGVTTVECKSGYGLSAADEIKQLRVYERLRKQRKSRIVSTFLGAHTVPPEFKDDRQGYLDLLLNEMIPTVAGEKLAQFCDVFVEESAFSLDEARKVLETGKEYGLKPKLHADQLSDGRGAELAAEVSAVSADHLENVSDDGIKRMAEAGIVGVTLPIASLYTQQPYLDCRRLVDKGVNVAVATDFNPGSAPSYDLHLAMMLACNHGRLTPAGALKGATYFAAKALNAEDEIGSIEKGKKADFVLIDATNLNFWLYHFHGVPVKDVFLSGIHIQF